MKRGSFIKSLILAFLFIPKATKEVTGHIKRIKWGHINCRCDTVPINYNGSWKPVNPKAKWKGVVDTRSRHDDINGSWSYGELNDIWIESTVFNKYYRIKGGFRCERNIKDSKGNVISTEKVYTDLTGKEIGRETITFGESKVFIIG